MRCFSRSAWAAAKRPARVLAPSVSSSRRSIRQRRVARTNRLTPATVQKYLALTTRPPKPGVGVPQLIVWPEGALPASLDGYLVPGDPVQAAIMSALSHGQTLITYRISSRFLPCTP